VNNCFTEVNCGDCISPDICSLAGECISPAECTDTCEGRTCGTVCGTTVCGGGDGTCTLDHATSVCDMETGTCVITDCEMGWDNCDNLHSNGCEVQLGTTDYCTSCTDSCTAGVQRCAGINEGCTSCNYVWTGASEDSGVECDGTPFPTHCLVGCTCDVNYVTNSTGGCSLDVSNVVSCASYCALFPGYVDGFCQQNPNKCLPETYIGYIPEGNATLGEVLCKKYNTNTPSCCCVDG